MLTAHGFLVKRPLQHLTTMQIERATMDVKLCHAMILFELDELFIIPAASSNATQPPRLNTRSMKTSAVCKSSSFAELQDAMENAAV